MFNHRLKDSELVIMSHLQIISILKEMPGPSQNIGHMTIFTKNMKIKTKIDVKIDYFIMFTIQCNSLATYSFAKWYYIVTYNIKQQNI